MNLDAASIAASSEVFRWLERSFYALATLGIVFALMIDLVAESGTWRRVILGAAAAVGSLFLSRRSPETAAALLVFVSFALSVAGFITIRADATPGLALAAGLILMSGVLGHTGLRTTSIALLASIFVAILLANLAFSEPLVAMVLTLVFWTCAAASIGAGYFLYLGAEQRDRSVTEARNSERLEMARELHDVVAHHVTGIVVQAQAGQFVAESNPKHAKQILAEIEEAGGEAMASMRHLVESLRTGDRPLDASMNARGDLDGLVQSVRDSGVEVHVAVDDLPASLAPTVVRLTREAFTNTRRHSPEATAVTLTVRTDPTTLFWEVEDNGRAKTPNPRPGYGLVGMRERVESLNGHFTAGHDGDKWAVSATIPIDTMS